MLDKDVDIKITIEVLKNGNIRFKTSTAEPVPEKIMPILSFGILTKARNCIVEEIEKTPEFTDFLEKEMAHGNVSTTTH
jgi:hypothetical protein